MADKTGYVIVEWIDDLPGYPRFGFATMVHAEELGDSIRCLEKHGSMEAAAKCAERLNGARRSR